MFCFSVFVSAKIKVRLVLWVIRWNWRQKKIYFHSGFAYKVRFSPLFYLNIILKLAKEKKLHFLITSRDWHIMVLSVLSHINLKTKCSLKVMSALMRQAKSWTNPSRPTGGSSIWSFSPLCLLGLEKLFRCLVPINHALKVSVQILLDFSAV